MAVGSAFGLRYLSAGSVNPNFRLPCLYWDDYLLSGGRKETVLACLEHFIVDEWAACCCCSCCSRGMLRLARGKTTVTASTKLERCRGFCLRGRKSCCRRRGCGCCEAFGVNVVDADPAVEPKASLEEHLAGCVGHPGSRREFKGRRCRRVGASAPMVWHDMKRGTSTC